MGHWIVGRLKVQREDWAIANIRRQGFEYYLPLVAPPANTQKRISLFPGYIFVYTDGRWRCLVSTFGLIGIVKAGGQPAIMPQEAIDEIKSREHDGYVRLPSDAAVVWTKGQSVRITGGAFGGMVGIYDGSSSRDRSRVLLDILGRKAQVLIDGTYLAAA